MKDDALFGKHSCGMERRDESSKIIDSPPSIESQLITVTSATATKKHFSQKTKRIDLMKCKGEGKD